MNRFRVAFRYWKLERFRAVGVSMQRQQMRCAHICAQHTGSDCSFRYNHRERLRQENVQTIVSARVDMHKNPPLKLDPSEFRVKKGTSKEVEEQLALERKRMEVAEAKQVQCASCFPRKIAPVSRAKSPLPPH